MDFLNASFLEGSYKVSLKSFLLQAEELEMLWLSL